MTDKSRRTFLKLAAVSTGAGIGLGALPPSIRKALAISANSRTGTIKDVEHVVILMQENRSFDHYFGMLKGVRGFSDPRAITLPSGKSVLHQPGLSGRTVTPFHLDSKTTAAQCMESLDHSWKGSHARWKHYDAWIAAKGEMTMGHFSREDLPFYYALADTFTICDAYHCSLFGPTNPNRMFLFTGTSGLAVGNDGIQAVTNPPDEQNETADQKNDAKGFAGYGWTTYAERLQEAGIDWRVYQEFDNYGDNALAYFARFRNLDPVSEFHRRARAWVPGSNPDNAKQSRGEYLVNQFAADVASDRLPQVSWIVAPYIMCEHPAAPPAYGESLVSRLLDALASHPEVFAKTVFILNYDENDGFFDHVPPAVPPIDPAMGKSTVDVTGETNKGEPVGLGPRVPLLIVSPWSKGGFVNSQLFDHTSVIRFLEARFGVHEPNITPWRRAVCGDLTSAFDFTTPDTGWTAQLPTTDNAFARADETCKLHAPKRPEDSTLPVQEPGGRPARPLPYALEAEGIVSADGGELALIIDNRGGAGAALTLYADGSKAGPWFYTVEAGKSFSDRVPLAKEVASYCLHGPNGFLRAFATTEPRLQVAARHDAATDGMVVTLRNLGTEPRTVTIAARGYLSLPKREHLLAPGESKMDSWPIAESRYWYDLEVTAGSGSWRFAGHVETGRPGVSDPALGRG